MFGFLGYISQGSVANMCSGHCRLNIPPSLTVVGRVWSSKGHFPHLHPKGTDGPSWTEQGKSGGDPLEQRARETYDMGSKSFQQEEAHGLLNQPWENPPCYSEQVRCTPGYLEDVKLYINHHYFILGGSSKLQQRAPDSSETKAKGQVIILPWFFVIRDLVESFLVNAIIILATDWRRSL